MITMLEEGSGGFLGLGARPYKVRIMPRPGGPIREPRDERGSREGRERRGRERGGRGRNGRDNRRDAAGRGDRGPRRDDRGGRGDDAARRPDDRARREERGRDGRGRDIGRDLRPRAERRDAPVRDERGGRRDEALRHERRPDRPRDERPGEAMPAEPRDEAVRRERFDERGVDRRPIEPRAAGAAGVPPAEGVGESSGEREERRRRRRRRHGRGHGERDLGAPVQAPAGVAEEDVSAEPGVADEREAAPQDAGGPTLAPAELETEGKRLTEEFLKVMGFEATVSAHAEGDRVDVVARVTSDEDLLTGRKGEVRQALQHLLNRMVNRGEGSRYHLQLEINDFWKQREDELRQLAHDLAEEAVANRAESVTEYLNAQERRVIHVTLREDSRVKTYAIGTGMIKRLAVAPADFPEPEREDD
jgi:predicted RNA-binding protein Jag